MNEQILEPDTGENSTKKFRGEILRIELITTAKNEQMAKLQLDNGLSIVVFPRTWREYRADLEMLMVFGIDVMFDCRIENSEYFLNTFAEIPQIPLHEVVPSFTNHKALSDALRKDMRDASKQLLILHQILIASQNGQGYLSQSTIEYLAIDLVGRALGALDCTDHLEEVQDA